MRPGSAEGRECKIQEWPCDLRGPELLADDVLAEPIRYVDGRLILPPGPGFAAALDRARLTTLAGDLDSHAA